MTQARHSFVAAKCGHKILAPITYKGICNTALFEKGIEKILLPKLSPGQLIIMDNATFHKSKCTKNLMESAHCPLLFCPLTALILIPLSGFGHGLKGKFESS